MEKFLKAIKILKVLGILIVIGVIFYLADYVIYRKTGNSLAFFKHADVQVEGEQTPALENIVGNNTEEKEDRAKLNEELKEVEDEILKETIEAFLNQRENNGFILHFYKNPSEIDPYYIFTTSKYMVKEEEKIKQYENLTNTMLTTALYKVSADEAIEVLLNKTGVEFSKNDIRNMMVKSFMYLPQFDSYYALNSDDLFTKVKCTKIEDKGDNWAVSYESEEETGNYVKGIVTLKKASNQNTTLFVSNNVADIDMNQFH